MFVNMFVVKEDLLTVPLLMYTHESRKQKSKSYKSQRELSINHVNFVKRINLTAKNVCRTFHRPMRYIWGKKEINKKKPFIVKIQLLILTFPQIKRTSVNTYNGSV